MSETYEAVGILGLTEPLTEMLAAVSRIDGVDIELALSRISWKQSVLETCVAQTAEAMDEKLRKMSSLLSCGDLRGFFIEAHGLKVALAGIGATGHSELAAKLESESKSGNAPDCKKDFILFAGLAKELARELKSVMPQESTEKREKGDSRLLFKVVKEASECLEIFETDDALECIKKLDALTFGEETDNLLRRIRNRINAYKYDEAALLLESIMEQSEHITTT